MQKEGLFFDHPDFVELNEVLHRLASEKSVAREAVAIAWLLRHPAHMQPIIGSMNPERITAICEASNITLSREEWYEVYRSGDYPIP